MTTLFPVSDFNFVLCGLATIAASVGYACTRRLAASTPTSSSLSPEQDTECQEQPTHEAKYMEPSLLPSSDSCPTSTKSQDNIDSEAILPVPEIHSLHIQRSSLKRKLTDDDDEAYAAQGYSNGEGAAYPNKRNKTPPAPESIEELVPAEEKPENIPDSHVDTLISDGILTEEKPVNEKTLLETPQDSSDPVGPSISPAPESSSLASVFRPVPVYPPQFPGGFASFAGKASPFTLASSKSPNDKPAWATSASNDHSDGKAEAGVSIDEQSCHVIDQVAIPSEHHVKILTGEEDEEVEGELKGVKLFRKRGKLDFSIGMQGHVKLLAHTVEGNVKRRIVFRREPLWKVSMNVLLQPIVRCSYDEQESVLRVILKEGEEGGASNGRTRKVVIYALKPGRSCSRDDFKKFSSLVVAAAKDDAALLKD